MAPRARLFAHLLLAGCSLILLVALRPDLDRTVLARGDELSFLVSSGVVRRV